MMSEIPFSPPGQSPSQPPRWSVSFNGIGCAVTVMQRKPGQVIKNPRPSP